MTYTGRGNQEINIINQDTFKFDPGSIGFALYGMQ